jgi:glutamine amidotransferase
MSTQNVTIIDYGMGNLFSIQSVFHKLGVNVNVSSEPDVISASDKLILPGVGAFQKAMEELKNRNHIEAINQYVATGKPLMGICLGMQLLFSQSEEFGLEQGLNLIPGKVIRFQKNENDEFKIPQIGWNSINHPKNNSRNWDNTILKDISNGTKLYFVHSYICYPDNKDHFLAETTYGNDSFCSVVNKDNIWGCQSHPEKSGNDGIRIYKNFIDL